MRGRVERLNQLKKMQEDGTFDMLPKKEVMKHLGEIAKLEKYLGGVTEMKKLPGALFVVDPRKERNAINEARKLNIPIVAIVDTNCDPDEMCIRDRCTTVLTAAICLDLLAYHLSLIHI